MTKAELLAALAPFPAGARVVLIRSEGGYDDPQVQVQWVGLDRGDGRRSGRHDDVYGYRTLDGLTPAVVLLAADDPYLVESDASAWDAVMRHDNQPEMAKESR